jgi:hypothetical protein
MTSKELNIEKSSESKNRDAAFAQLEQANRSLHRQVE